MHSMHHKRHAKRPAAGGSMQAVAQAPHPPCLGAALVCGEVVDGHLHNPHLLEQVYGVWCGAGSEGED